METPKRQVSLLESSPPDVWAHFACYLPGEQLGRLMMTGATQLRRRLKSPGVVKSINLGDDYLIFKSFPAFLRELPSLEELVIYSCSYTWSDKLGMRIDMLPSGLRKLELNGDWRNSSKLFGEPGTPLMLCKHLPRLEILHLSCFDFSDCSWMLHSPPSLTSVRLPRWNGDVELPASLIDFEAYEGEISRGTLVSKLPPRLESFTISDSVGIDLVIPLLPPSTRRLSPGVMSCRGVRETPQKLLEQLPKSLTWWEPGELDFNFESNPELVSLLPPTLKTLDSTKFIPCSAWHLLPQQLTDLTFLVPDRLDAAVTTTITDHQGIEHEVRSVPFDSLPVSITRLELHSPAAHFCGSPGMSTKSYFPPNLTSLILRNIHLSPGSAKLLPSSLSHLEIGNLCERACKHLPNHLKILISRRTLMSPNLIKFLPKSLTTLHLNLVDPEHPWFDCNSGKAINHASELPEYSIHEDCMSNNFDWKDASPLPSTLTDFSIDNAEQLGDSFLKYQQLPPYLLKLRFYDSQHFTDLSIPILPFNLTTLHLASSSGVSGKSFPTLPRYLTDLRLSESDSIFDPDIQHLPRTLQIAYLSSAIHLTDLCVPDLPPHLETLNLQHNSNITPSSFPLFPYALRSTQRSSTAIFAKWKIDEGLIKKTR